MRKNMNSAFFMYSPLLVDYRTGFDLTSGSLLLVVFFPSCKKTPEYLNVPEKTMESVELNQ